MTRLLIVGCGPKAIAIAAKAHVLGQLGWKVPEIVVIDKHGPAANWDGTNGYTGADVLLGTTPLEDVGFPYASLLDRSVDEAMLRFSYVAYLINRRTYAEWVDRGLRAPTHGMLASYLQWVLRATETSIQIGSVTAVARRSEHWSVVFTDGDLRREIEADALVLTGPGDPYRFPRTRTSYAGEHRIFNGQTVWHSMQIFKDMRDARIGVIGGGETAAAIVTALLSALDKSSQVEIVSRHPILFTRNENWMEVMYFSTATNWSELSERARAEIIHHADRGTFSAAAKDLLDCASNVVLRYGSALTLSAGRHNVSVVLEKDGDARSVEYDYVVEATGFDPFSVLKLFSDPAFLGDLTTLPTRMDQNLCVSGLSPTLHVPGLSALAQGPGFPNLSCLGLLAERILMPYIEK